MRHALTQAGPGDEANKILFPLFAEMAFHFYKDEISAYRFRASLAD